MFGMARVVPVVKGALGSVDVGFEVDDPGTGQCLADLGFGVVDRGGDVFALGVLRDCDLGGDQQLVGSASETSRRPARRPAWSSSRR
jgi:hypothetical protein